MLGTISLLATSKVTSMSTGSTNMTAVTVRWKEPSHLPYLFRVKASCKLLCAQELYKHVDETLPDSATEMEINGLHPGSTCIVNFFAFFNPASVDPGLMVRSTTGYDSMF